MIKAYSERSLVYAYRLLNPLSRIRSILKYHLNTGTRQNKVCVLCGCRGPTWASAWPQTKRAIQWEDDHIQSHLKFRKALDT